jgi:hypothetical protein
MKKEKEDRGKADNVAGAAYEFWTLMGQVMEELRDDINTDLMTELPAPSPDSITVTTEFGVSEEPSNFTVISAGLPPPSSTPEHDDVVPSQDTLDESMVLGHTTPPPIALDFSIEVPAEDMADDEGDDVDDLDDEDIIAESALIDEFIDDDALTPTMTTTVSNI